MAVKKALRKSAFDVRNQKATALENKRLRADKAAAYDVKYKADALARREKLAAEAAKPAEPAKAPETPQA
jgi:hypothetical protein